MEQTFHNAQKEIANVFQRIDKDLTTLNECMNCRQERETSLAKEVQRDCDQQWKLIHCLEALEQQEQEREVQITLQEDQIWVLQQEVNELQGKICGCHECLGVTKGPVLMETTDSTDRMDDGLEYEDDEEYLTPPTNLQTMLSMSVYQFSPPSTYTTPQPIIQSEPEEDCQVIWSCCRTRVVEYIDNLVKIADDERSSLLDLSLSKDDDLPELENQENVVTIPIPPPADIPPPYAMSGQCAVQSRGVPKSTFHPYPCNRHPLGKLYE